MAPDDDDTKVKQVLDTATRDDLERWFTLPSFQQLAEQPPAAGEQDASVDPEIKAVLERRVQATANVDPVLLAAIGSRTDENPRDFFFFKPDLETKIDPEFGMVNHGLLAKAYALGEPRDYELPIDLEDELKECAPQALLRDLHRPELYFDKVFEVVDVAAEQRLDIVAEVDAAMRTDWRLPELERPLAGLSDLLGGLRAERARPWTEYLAKLPNRTVRE